VTSKSVSWKPSSENNLLNTIKSDANENNQVETTDFTRIQVNPKYYSDHVLQSQNKVISQLGSQSGFELRNSHDELNNYKSRSVIAIERNNKNLKEKSWNISSILKYTLIGGSILATKYLVYYVVMNQEEALNFINSIEFTEIPLQYQILIAFILIVVVVYIAHEITSLCKNNSIAEKVYLEIKEIIVDNGDQLTEEDIISFYSADNKISRNDFKINVLPEVKRLAILSNITIRDCYDDDEELLDTVWEYNQS
jgi:hypothetical protein